MSTRLRDLYQDKVVPEFKKLHNLGNSAEVPKIIKVVVNVGMAEPQHQDKALENMSEQLMVVTGQKPRVNRAKKSISGFNLREGDPIGLMVTLRGKRMYQFLDKLIHIVLPRVKDFQGVSREAFDQGGNYSIGFEEQIVFPEIEYGKIDAVRGLQVTIVTNTSDSQKAQELLELLGMPFTKQEEPSRGE
jgi:large subunit ribosomal protein L5